MTLANFFFWIFIVFGMVNLVHIGLYVVGANLYDIKQFRRERAKRLAARAAGIDADHAAAEARAKRPFVTVLIPAHNEQAAILRCLESVYASTYDRMAIVVVDDASTDKTAAIVRNFIARHTASAQIERYQQDGYEHRKYVRPFSKPVMLVSREKNAGKAAGLNYILEHYVREGLTMTLDADSVLDAHAIENAVAYFEDERIVGVAANVQVMDQLNVLGMLQKFEHMVGYRSKKFYAMTNSEFIIGGVASTYRYDTLARVKFYDTDTTTEDIGLSMKIVSGGNREQRITYAADVVAHTEGVQNFKALLKQRYRWKMGSLQNLFKYRAMLGENSETYSRMLTMYRLPMAFLSELMLIMQPFIMAYVVYLSIVGGTLAMMVGGYFTITLYILWTIWPDEHHSLVRKLGLSLYAPLMYFCFYIMDFVQIVAIFRCLGHVGQITGRKATSSTWVSPERVQAQAA